MSDLVETAASFAKWVHRNQKRKYTHEPYFHHVSNVAKTLKDIGAHDALVAAGFLHDVVEDTEVTLPMVDTIFGSDVALLVGGVTDVSKPSDGNREIRKTLDRIHLSKGSPDVKTLKLSDTIDNTPSIVSHDIGFAKIYLREKALLLPHLVEGDQELFRTAWFIVDTGCQRLGLVGPQGRT